MVDLSYTIKLITKYKKMRGSLIPLLHDIQKILLKRLLQQNGQKYSTLTVGYNFEDNIVFHLKQLISHNLIEKLNGNYLITAEGIKTITQYDLTTIKDLGFKTFFIGFLCNFEDQYLIKEHPTESKNFYNLPSGKPRFGEPIDTALIRTFEENTGIVLKASDFEYKSLHLKTVKTSDGEVLFDDAFTIYQVNINLQQKDSMKLNKQISWKSTKDIESLSDRWPELDLLILQGDKTTYRTYEFVSDYVLT